MGFLCPNDSTCCSAEVQHTHFYLGFQGKRLPGSPEDWQRLSPKQRKEYLLGVVVKTCATGKFTVCNNDLCLSYEIAALCHAVCWCCICSVFVYQQTKYSPNHGTGLCPVLLTGELIALVLELAVKEIRKVKHSRVAVVAWQLEKNSNIWYS